MTIPISLSTRSIATAMLLVAAIVVLIATLAVTLWSVLGAEPQLIGPTRWLEAMRTFA
jgi:hypothetical protein